MFDNELSRFVLWIISIIFGLIIALLQTYGCYRIYSIRHLLIIQKRYYKIVLIESIAAALYLSISFPGLSYNVLHPKPIEHSGLKQFVMRSGFFLYPYLGHFIVNAELSRLWLIYFDLNCLNASKNNAWKSTIDSTKIQTNWFLNNKYKYGNSKWVTIRVFVIYLFIALISCILFNLHFLTNPQFVMLIDGLLYGIPMSTILYIYYKCPKKLDDYFLFHYEFKITALFFFPGVTI
eukprot:553719_1